MTGVIVEDANGFDVEWGTVEPFGDQARALRALLRLLGEVVAEDEARRRRALLQRRQR